MNSLGLTKNMTHPELTNFPFSLYPPFPGSGDFDFMAGISVQLPGIPTINKFPLPRVSGEGLGVGANL
jgi:hypothetical protein